MAPRPWTRFRADRPPRQPTPEGLIEQAEALLENRESDERLRKAIDRHIKEEIASQKHLIEETELTIADVYRRLKNAALEETVRAARPAWEAYELASRAADQVSVQAGVSKVLKAAAVIGLPGGIAGLAVLSGSALATIGALLPLLVIGAVLRWRRSRTLLVDEAPSAAFAQARAEFLRDRFDRLVLEVHVRPELLALLNRAPELVNQLTLEIRAHGLAELSNVKFEIATATADQLRDTLKHMPGGSLGFAGPRGVGKTTLLRSLCGPAARTQSVALMVTAPVKYEAREFLLSLFAKLCLTVAPGSSTDDNESLGDIRPAGAALATRYAGLLALALIASGFAALAFGRQIAAVPARDAYGVAAVVAGYLLLGAWLSPRLRRAASRLFARSAPDIPADLHTTARSLLRDIRFQQSYSSGYSGQLKLPVGMQVGSTASVQLAQRQKSFPELVEQFRAFLEAVVGERGKAFIGVDELDKLESAEVAQQFLNELKAIFGVEGCFYLVSISEEAMSTFGRRGSGFRDVFDSSFDDVIIVRPLTFAEAQRLLRRRVLGLGAPFIGLCHALSGGLARELIRVARRLAQLQDTTTGPIGLDAAALALVHHELDRQTEAVMVALRSRRPTHTRTRELAWASSLEAFPTAARLLAACQSCPTLGEFSPGDTDSAAGTVSAFELAVSAYLLATTLDVFSDARFAGRDPQSIWQDIDTELTNDLAYARELLSVDLGLAWREVTRIRRALRLQTIDLPHSDWTVNGSQALLLAAPAGSSAAAEEPRNPSR